MSLSVCVICFNEAQNIARCLESARWADELIVVDSMSRDETLDIAKRYTGKVYQRAWTGYVDQKNYALSMAGSNWVLSLDADEEVSSALKDEIIGKISDPSAHDGYRMPRCSFYQGRWIKHSGFYPDRQLRLFRRDHGRWTGGRVHEGVEIKGRIGDLKNDLLHYPYKGSIRGQLQTVNNFSSLLAEDLYDKGGKYRLSLLLMRPLFKFIEVYFFKLGLLDGLAGFIIAITSSYAMFVRYVKLRELQNHLHIR